jgi:putative protease
MTCSPHDLEDARVAQNSPQNEKETPPAPLILAPAGGRDAFLAALAAGADAVYCGLKAFSARMAAQNFSVAELATLTRLAHERGVRVHVALNTLLKPEDLDHAGSLLVQLAKQVQPDALIFQDPAVPALARQAGLRAELHLSTLANLSFAQGLAAVRKQMGVSTVVLPRELSIDEIKAMARACPPNLALEVFVHGALCYAVSGRCYWSSWFGGKSGLRGRCVQPCRRRYTQGGPPRKFFSCQDLSLDVLVKVLADIPAVRVWKIEGRKKGPHYVYYTTRAYRLLRDAGRDPQTKRTALALLERSLGRQVTHYHFLPQRPQNPIPADGRTGSGLFVGKVRGEQQALCLVPREALLAGDLLRLGFEDETAHAIQRVGKFVPKGGRLILKPGAARAALKGVPVFLIDRREKALADMLAELEGALSPPQAAAPAAFQARLPAACRGTPDVSEVQVHRMPVRPRGREAAGCWISPGAVQASSPRAANRLWWWLPPVVWPDTEKILDQQVAALLNWGVGRFVLNAPWQAAFFPQSDRLQLWAGPFCNIANPLALQMLADAGFSGAVASPELAGREFLALPAHSPLPLGVVLAGHWPLCISRVVDQSLALAQPFESPKGEQAWVKRHEAEYWVYPEWRLDLSSKKEALRQAGYRLFFHLNEPVPQPVSLKQRPGVWNWDLGLT